jgi:hypothetical protein
MAKERWHHSMVEAHNVVSPVWGCQHSRCNEKATHGWQRDASQQEIDAEANLQGPYGKVIRSTQGPHLVAVFSCAEHAPAPESMARAHNVDCPAPDPGCDCDGAD